MRTAARSMTVDLPHSGHSVRAEAIVIVSCGDRNVELDQLTSVYEVPVPSSLLRNAVRHAPKATNPRETVPSNVRRPSAFKIWDKFINTSLTAAFPRLSIAKSKLIAVFRRPDFERLSQPVFRSLVTEHFKTKASSQSERDRATTFT